MNLVSMRDSETVRSYTPRDLGAGKFSDFYGFLWQWQEHKDKLPRLKVEQNVIGVYSSQKEEAFLLSQAIGLLLCQ